MSGANLFYLRQADIDGQRLVRDVIKNVSRPIAFDTVMRVRTSTGIRPTDFYGHFFMSNTTDLEIASIGKRRNRRKGNKRSPLKDPLFSHSPNRLR